MNIKALLQNAQALLGEGRSGEILLAYVLKQSQTFLYTYPEKTVTPEEVRQFENLITQRQQGMPIAYLIGEKEFYSLNFKVTKDTLIPRPETELLIDEALKILPVDNTCKILELGTGSGAIAITLAKHLPNAQILATDISANALQVARENAQHYDLNNINFLLSDWFTKIPNQTFDVIISNPPYVVENDPHLLALRHEPLSALTAGEKGLDCLEKIIAKAPEYLSKDGWLLLEHGYDQENSVQQLLKTHHFQSIKTITDLATLPRVTLSRLI
jgi:release factor glutamine methyltransferase